MHPGEQGLPLMHIFRIGQKAEGFTILMKFSLYIWLLKSNCSFKILSFCILGEPKHPPVKCAVVQTSAFVWGGVKLWGSHRDVWLTASSLLHPAHLWALPAANQESAFHSSIWFFDSPALTHPWRALIRFSSLASWHPRMGVHARISVGRQGS